MSTKFLMPVAVPLILHDRETDNILLSRRYNTGYEDGNYSVVSGHVEEHETVIQAMIREAKEEIGITLNEANLEFVRVIHRNSGIDQRIDFFFRANKWEGKAQNMEPEKCDEILWSHINALPDNVIPHVREILHTRDKKGYSSYGWK